MEAFYKCYPKRSPKLLLDVVTKRDLYWLNKHISPHPSYHRYPSLDQMSLFFSEMPVARLPT